MHVTSHATKRFLERVLNKIRYTHAEYRGAREELENLFVDMVPGSYARPFALPRHKGFLVVHRENRVITILPKRRRS
jgi:hypothetical protein